MTNAEQALQAELISALRTAKIALSFCGKSAQARALNATAFREVDRALAKVGDNAIHEAVVSDALSVVQGAA